MSAAALPNNVHSSRSFTLLDHYRSSNRHTDGKQLRKALEVELHNICGLSGNSGMEW